MGAFQFFLVATISVVSMSVVFALKVYASGRIAGRYKTIRLTARHNMWVDIYLLSVVATVLFIKLLLLVTRRDIYEIHLLDTSLGQIHLFLDVLFISTLVIMRWLVTGKFNPGLHKIFSKVALGSYICILGTGIWLMLRLIYPI